MSNDKSTVAVQPAAPAAGPARRRRTLLAWLALVACCALFAAGVRGVEMRRRLHERREMEYRAKYQELVRVAGPYLAESRQTVEGELNRGRPLHHGSTDPAAYGAWMPGKAIGDRYDGWVLRMRFKQDRLYGVHLVPPPRTPYKWPSRTWVHVEGLRRGVIVAAGVAWVLAAVTTPFARRWTRQLAQVCLGAVLVAGVAWALNPYFTFAWPTFSAPVPIGLGVAAILSVIGLFLPVPAGGRDGWRWCAGCGYDLTGNESGVCPECGRPTPRMLAGRWQGLAARLESVEAGSGGVDDDDAGGEDVGLTASPLPR